MILESVFSDYLKSHIWQGSAEQSEQAAVKQDIRSQCGKTHVWVKIMKFLQTWQEQTWHTHFH